MAVQGGAVSSHRRAELGTSHFAATVAGDGGPRSPSGRLQSWSGWPRGLCKHREHGPEDREQDTLSKIASFRSPSGLAMQRAIRPTQR